MGAKKQPSYRVVVANSQSPRNGRFIETVGLYNPLSNPPTARVNADKVRYWLSHGAQPTEPVKRILGWTGVIESPHAPSRESAASETKTEG